MSLSPERPEAAEQAPRKGQAVLIGGGVRSGKSAYAVERALEHGPRRCFIATAQAFDAEMEARIAAHQVERQERFETREVTWELVDTLGQIESRAAFDVVLVDCLSLWLSNLLLAEWSDEQILAESERLAEFVAEVSFPLYLVSNEVGMGVVPPSSLGRRFRDHSGRLHQLLGPVCGEVHFSVFGLLLTLKPGNLRLSR